MGQGLGAATGEGGGFALACGFVVKVRRDGGAQGVGDFPRGYWLPRHNGKGVVVQLNREGEQGVTVTTLVGGHTIVAHGR